MAASGTVLVGLAEVPGYCLEEGQLTFVCSWLARLTNSELVATTVGGAVPTILRILLIVVLAFVLHRVARRAIKRTVKRMTEQGMDRLARLREVGPLSETGPIDLERATMRTETLGSVLRSVSGAAIWTIAALMVLGSLGVSIGPLIAGAGVAGVALGFGAQTLVRDFLTGFFMLLEDAYGVGDYVDVGDAEGTVEAVTLRVTRLRSINGVLWHVPNGQILRAGNFSQRWARTVLDVDVAYGHDLRAVREVLEASLTRFAAESPVSHDLLEAPELWGVQELGDDGVALRVAVRTRPLRQWAVGRALRERIKHDFDAADIEIPFPQRAVWVRTEGEEPVEPLPGRPAEPSGGRPAEPSGGRADEPPYGPPATGPDADEPPDRP